MNNTTEGAVWQAQTVLGTLECPLVCELLDLPASDVVARLVSFFLSYFAECFLSTKSFVFGCVGHLMLFLVAHLMLIVGALKLLVCRFMAFGRRVDFTAFVAYKFF